MNQIGQRIKQFRKQNGLTQERLAEYLGVTDKAVSKWECGLTAPDLALIMPLARILHVSADELLGGKKEETDAKRLEYDEHYENNMKYDIRENYRVAQQAVKDYPNDYKYLVFLAHAEMSMAYASECKEDPQSQFFIEMMQRAIKHNELVIEECENVAIREEAIWNCMLCYKALGDHDKALECANMFPERSRFTKNHALDVCLQGEKQVQHKKWTVYNKLQALCIAFSRIYQFADKKEPYVIAALDAEEAILQVVFPDGNYHNFHKNLVCAYQIRAEFEILEGNLDQAMAYLRIMMEHARKVPQGEKHTLDGVFEGIEVKYPVDYRMTYVINGLDDIEKPIFEQLKNRLMQKRYTPLFDREDFQALIRS
ncbi:MAG: helix-turn-helix transcriptional regulator [Clostridia bacterium]|nr:helix-turn-helix transcriptional regulator [Clostridia bacterium]